MPVVVTDAAYCKDCGQPLTGNTWARKGVKGRRQQAAALSLLPGLGHWHKGQPVRGLSWFFFVGLMYLSSWPLGLVAHMICVLNAALGGTRSRRPLAIRYFRGRRRPANRARHRPSPAMSVVRPGG